MNLPKELTTVTPISKILAAVLFIMLPFIGFFLGMQYQEMMNLAKNQQEENNIAIARVPTPTAYVIPTVNPLITANWKTYKNNTYHFSFQYPRDYFKYITEEDTYPEDILLELEISPSDNRNFLKEVGLYLAIRTFDGSLEEFISQEPDYKSTIPIIIAGEKGYKSIKETAAQDPVARENFRNLEYKVIFKHNKFIYEFNLSGNKEKATIDLEKVFTQILATFKFTDQ